MSNRQLWRLNQLGLLRLVGIEGESISAEEAKQAVTAELDAPGRIPLSSSRRTFEAGR
jgi:hypothetical protein